MPKIIAFAGSSRKDSCNKKLARIAAKGARERGGLVSEIDLADAVLRQVGFNFLSFQPPINELCSYPTSLRKPCTLR